MPAALPPMLDLARQALANAHAPYSNFKVGAAILDESGHIHTGCNVENASYGLTMCAERVAIFKALSDGARRFVRVAGHARIRNLEGFRG